MGLGLFPSLKLTTAYENFHTQVGKLKNLFLFPALLAWFSETPANQDLTLPSLLPFLEVTATCWHQAWLSVIQGDLAATALLNPCLL